MAFRKLKHYSQYGMSAELRGPTPGQIKAEVAKTLRGVGFAAVVALSRTAKIIKLAHPAEMESVFDRPKPWTTGGVYSEGATKARPYAAVWLKNRDANYRPTYDFAAARAAAKGKGYRVSKRMSTGTPASIYLLPQIHGGPRPAKGIEVRLRSMGALAANEFLVPWAVKLDSYGNVPNGLWTKILSDQGALLDPMSNRAGTAARMAYEAAIGVKSKKKRSKYFIATIKGSRAIWERQANNSIVPLLRIVKNAPQYRKRYDFVGFSNKIFRANFKGELRRAIREGFAKVKPVK